MDSSRKLTYINSSAPHVDTSTSLWQSYEELANHGQKPRNRFIKRLHVRFQRLEACFLHNLTERGKRGRHTPHKSFFYGCPSRYEGSISQKKAGPRRGDVLNTCRSIPCTAPACPFGTSKSMFPGPHIVSGDLDRKQVQQAPHIGPFIPVMKHQTDDFGRKAFRLRRKNVKRVIETNPIT